MYNLSSAAILEKNKLTNDGSFLILLEIQLTDGSILRLCRNTENIDWNGYTWSAFPFELDMIYDGEIGEVPSINLSVGNATRVIQTYIEGNDAGVGSTVIIRVVHSKHLDISTAEIELEFSCVSCVANSQYVVFTLGASNPFRQRYPKNRALKNNCRWKFKSTECGYSGYASTCNKTLPRCRALGNSGRFGGFPGVGSSGLYV